MRRELTEKEAIKRMDALIDGACLVYENAEELYYEAELLAENGALSRAYFLHQISLEECGKLEIIGAAIMDVVTESRFDEKLFRKNIRSHKAKNYANSYFLKANEEELKARENKQYIEEIEIFNNRQNDFHMTSNDLKNDALYVNIEGQKATKPKNVITAELLEEMKQRNSEFMGMANHKINMLWRMKENKSAYSEFLKYFVEMMKEIKEESESIDEAVELNKKFMDYIIEKLREMKSDPTHNG